MTARLEDQEDRARRPSPRPSASAAKVRHSARATYVFTKPTARCMDLVISSLRRSGTGRLLPLLLPFALHFFSRAGRSSSSRPSCRRRSSPAPAASSRRLVEPADVRLAVVGPFALGVGVVDDQSQKRAPVPGGRPLRASAGRRRSCRTRRSAGGRCAAGCRPACPSLSSMKSISGSLTQHGLAVAHLELHLAAAADDLLGRNAIHLLGQGAHELDAAAGDDERLEAVRPQVGEQFEHRLVDHLGVQAAWSSDASRSRSSPSRSSRIPRWSCRRAWPSTISTIACSPPASAPFRSPLSSEANGSLFFHSGCCGASAFTRSSAKSELEIHRLLGPERAVVVERGDALGGRDEVRRALLGDFRDEVDDGLFGRAVVPGRERVGGPSMVAVNASAQTSAAAMRCSCAERSHRHILLRCVSVSGRTRSGDATKDQREYAEDFLSRPVTGRG